MRRRNNTKVVDKKYEYDGIIKIVKDNYDLKNIIIKDATLYTNLLDVEDFSIHVNGKIQFTKGDGEGRKKGYWKIIDVSPHEDQLTPEEMASCLSWGNIEGQHLFVFLSNSGEMLENTERYVNWFKRVSATGDCKINIMEIKKSDLLEIASIKEGKMNKLREELFYLENKFKVIEKINKIKELTARPWQGTSAEENEFLKNNDLEYYENLLKIDKKARIKQIEDEIIQNDADDLISDDEEEEERPVKKRKVILDAPLKKADRDIADAETLSDLSSSTDDDYDSNESEEDEEDEEEDEESEEE
jgi:hypothetical protein